MGSRKLWLLLVLAGCAQADPRLFALAPVVTRDPDLDSARLACAGTPKCAPAQRESPFVWDAVDNTVFGPASGFFRARRGGEAEDVNALDEVPDSSWFHNRLGTRPMTPDEVFQGYCAEGRTLDPHADAGAWLVDRGKENGANPGFRVVVSGTKYLLKTDNDGEGERATAATAIATRLYHAAGFWTPCDAIVYFHRNVLRLAPNLTVRANAGAAKPFDQAALDRQLAKAERRGPLVRMVASRWLPGEPIGPTAYVGTRHDDPNDVIPHERRRALRGSRLLAAWLNHFDAREQNTMSTWLPDEPAQSGRGHVRHWQLDLGDCFGSQWDNDVLSRKLGTSYFLDGSYMVEDFVSLGIPQRPWDTATIQPGLETFGYFGATRFDPEAWRAEYPMRPFTDMTEADGAWMARILARFGRAHVAAAVAAGDFTDPALASYLVDVLVQRQYAILRRYLGRLSPLTDVSRHGDEWCALDLARETHTFADSAFHYTATVRRGLGAPQPASVRNEGARVCVQVPSQPHREAADAAERYVVVRVQNAASRGPLELHAYDLDGGMVLAGIERP